jgi:superfamily II DNA/RNA helicase
MSVFDACLSVFLISAVVLTPTRELAMQITSECKKFTKSLGLSSVCVYGGTGISEQIADLRRGCEIVVCTPGRMIDMLTANNGKVKDTVTHGNCSLSFLTFVYFHEKF